MHRKKYVYRREDIVSTYAKSWTANSKFWNISGRVIVSPEAMVPSAGRSTIPGLKPHVSICQVNGTYKEIIFNKLFNESTCVIKIHVQLISKM